MNKKRSAKPEASFQRSVISFLEVRYKCLVLQVNQGGMKVPDITRRCGYRYVPFTRGQKGVSDILACSPEGIFIAVECKAPGGKLTDDQVAFLERVERNNGIAIVADSIPSFECQYRTQRRIVIRKIFQAERALIQRRMEDLQSKKGFYETLDDMDQIIKEGEGEGRKAGDE